MATSTTSNPSGITVGLREDLDDIISNIAPTDTVFLSNISKVKVKAVTHEWLEDTLASAANNSVTEGNDAVWATIVAPQRYHNTAQISAKWFKISDVLETVDKAGMKSQIAYTTSQKLKELARDMEYALINNATETTSDPRSLKGLKGWITSNVVNFTTGTSVTTITETRFNDDLQRCWSRGGNPNMVLAPAFSKRKISSFTGNSKLTTTIPADETKVILSVDYYECDFGIVKVYASRFIATDDNTMYESIFYLEKEKFQLGSLIPVKTEKLAKTGLGQGVQISTTYTLISRAESASSRMKNICNA